MKRESMKHPYLATYIPLLLLVGILSAQFPAGAQDKPNVVLIMCDDLGWGTSVSTVEPTSPHHSSMKWPPTAFLRPGARVFADPRVGGDWSAPRPHPH